VDWKTVLAGAVGISLGPIVARKVASSPSLQFVALVLCVIFAVAALGFAVLGLFPGLHPMFFLAFGCALFAWGFYKRANGRPYWSL
jgi:hypothetical protein